MTYAIITPARNEEDYIELTLESVVQQTVRPVKWLIVSDGSTDRTDEIVSRYVRKYDWIELIRMPERNSRDFSGKAGCFNAGYAYLKQGPPLSTIHHPPSTIRASGGTGVPPRVPSSVLCPPSSDQSPSTIRPSGGTGDSLGVGSARPEGPPSSDLGPVPVRKDLRPSGGTGDTPVSPGDSPGVGTSAGPEGPPTSDLRPPTSDFSVIVSLDADLSFDENYFSFLLQKLAEDPKLGVVGTPFSEHGETYDYRFSSTEYVSGACQVFRRECFDAIGGYTPLKGGGIDVVAVQTARLLGWQARTFPERFCIHHRPMGSANHTDRLLATFKLGRRAYTLGWHPVWQIFRSIYQMTKKPYLTGGCALFCGYFWSMLHRVERPVSAELIAFQRREQMKRLRAFFASCLRLKLGATSAPGTTGASPLSATASAAQSRAADPVK